MTFHYCASASTSTCPRHSADGSVHSDQQGAALYASRSEVRRTASHLAGPWPWPRPRSGAGEAPGGERGPGIVAASEAAKKTAYAIPVGTAIWSGSCECGQAMSLRRCTDSGGIGNVDEATRLHVVQVPIDRDPSWNQRMVTNACDVLGDALGVVGDRKPVDVLRLGRAGTCADVGKPFGAELGGLEAVPEQAADDVVCEELHAAVRVVYHEPLRGTEQLVGDDERADRVIAGAAAGVADDVRVTLAETGVPRRVESCVHAGED